MNILFIHQNFPGQFKHLAIHLAQQPGWRVFGLGDAANLRDKPALPGVTVFGYRHQHRKPTGHVYLQGLEDQVRRGQDVLRSLLELKRKGVVLGLIVVHPSWGEALFLREAFPDSKILCYSEFYYRNDGADAGFDPEFPPAVPLDSRCRLHLRNTVHLQAFAIADHIWTPSQWQASQLPEIYRARCSIIHEGIDTDAIRPDPDAVFQVKGLRLTRQDRIVTYVARNLEPYRGFHNFMRALPAIQQANPTAQFVVVGGNEVSYGAKPKDAANWREKLLAEVGDRLDPSRIHFLGKLPYADYLKLLQVSTAHVYLTYPFVLSWSLLEAMAAGCAIVASRTAPVEEVIADGENGVLVDFFDTRGLAEKVSDVQENTARLEPIRVAARATVAGRFDLKRICLPRLVGMLQTITTNALRHVA